MTSTTTPNSAAPRHSRPVRHAVARPGPVDPPIAGMRDGTGEEAPVTEARRLAAALARWYVEALAGRRDARSLRDLFTPAVLQRVRCAVLRESARRLAGGHGQGAVVEVRSVHVQEHGDRFEAVVVVDDGTRSTAVAATLHHRDGAWRVTDLARPEDRLPALATPYVPAT